MNVLNRLRINTKIWIGFGLALALLLVVSGVGSVALTSVDDGFGEYRGLARSTNAVGRVQANMLMTRMNVKDFIIRGTEEEAQEVRDYEAKTLDLTDEALDIVTDEHSLEVLQTIHKDVEHYVESFSKVTELQARRDELFNGTLGTVGPQMERDLSAIMKSAY